MPSIPECIKPVTGDVDVQDPAIGVCFGMECPNLRADSWAAEGDNSATAIVGANVKIVRACKVADHCIQQTANHADYLSQGAQDA